MNQQRFRQQLFGQHLDDLLLPVKFLKQTHHNVATALNAHVAMKADVIEHDDDYTVTAELPGFDKEAVAVTYADEWLTIRAHRSEDDGRNDDGRILHRERLTADLTRQFHLAGVARDQIQAHYQAGLLTVTLPKTVKITEGQIEIQ